ncbi:hypothetical protein R1sor_019679 [Riccia sorocarpa]|uniref:Uncharacterized protein n=1 Tax=Riccia sorocarpa TaxID=122646 RepID=A0ABD3IDC1_9MARC
MTKWALVLLARFELVLINDTSEGGSSGVRDGEVLSGSQESSKKVEAPNAVGVEDWNEEDFILSIEYFAKDCNLPNEGMMPSDIPKTLVSDEDIEKCFGPRSGNKGRNGPKLKNCTGLPQSEALHLFQVIDGHDKPVNGTLESIALSVGTYKTDKEVLGKLETERTELAARKQSLETRLEDGGFDDKNPEDMNLLQSLEAEEEDLNLSLSELLTKIEECSARLLQSQTEMKLSRSKHEELKMELERAELKVDDAQVVLRKEEALLAFQKEELRCLQPFAKSSVAPLIPRWIPTATEVGVERTILTSVAATKVRGISPCSTILSEREEDLRDLDVSLVDTSPVSRTRSKSRKRNLPKGDSVRKCCAKLILLPRLQMAGDTQSRFLGILDITKCWGPSEGQLTYAGCGRLLRDGRPCGLGLRARKTKENAACSANSQSGAIGSQISSQMGTLVNKSRDRAGHICSQIGEEVQLFHFFIETAEPRHELEVWKRAGQELLKMTGHEFFEKYGSDRHSLHKFVLTHLASTPWAITVIGKPSTEGYLRVLSCSRAGITSPIRSCFLVNPPQPHVGIVQIASDSPHPAYGGSGYIV